MTEAAQAGQAQVQPVGKPGPMESPPLLLALSGRALRQVQPLPPAQSVRLPVLALPGWEIRQVQPVPPAQGMPWPVLALPGRAVRQVQPAPPVQRVVRQPELVEVAPEAALFLIAPLPGAAPGHPRLPGSSGGPLRAGYLRL